MTSALLAKRLLLTATVLLAACSRGPKPVDAGPPMVALSVETLPSGAAVLEDGRDRLGKTPLILRRPAGSTVELQIVKDGFRTARRRVLLEQRAKQVLHVRLPRLTATLEIKTGFVRGARIFVDGQERGRAPGRVEVALGAHDVELRKRGVQPFRQRVVARVGGETIPIVAKLLRPFESAKTFGYLTVLSDRRAVVTSGEILLGTTPLARIKVPPRVYELTIEALDTKALRKATVEVKAKRAAKVQVTFGKGR